jgi:hypothetical protein
MLYFWSYNVIFNGEGIDRMPAVKELKTGAEKQYVLEFSSQEITESTIPYMDQERNEHSSPSQKLYEYADGAGSNIERFIGEGSEVKLTYRNFADEGKAEIGPSTPKKGRSTKPEKSFSLTAEDLASLSQNKEGSKAMYSRFESTRIKETSFSDAKKLILDNINKDNCFNAESKEDDDYKESSAEALAIIFGCELATLFYELATFSVNIIGLEKQKAAENLSGDYGNYIDPMGRGVKSIEIITHHPVANPNPVGYLPEPAEVFEFIVHHRHDRLQLSSVASCRVETLDSGITTIMVEREQLKLSVQGTFSELNAAGFAEAEIERFKVAKNAAAGSPHRIRPQAGKENGGSESYSFKSLFFISIISFLMIELALFLSALSLLKPVVFLGFIFAISQNKAIIRSFSSLYPLEKGHSFLNRRMWRNMFAVGMVIFMLMKGSTFLSAKGLLLPFLLAAGMIALYKRRSMLAGSFVRSILLRLGISCTTRDPLKAHTAKFATAVAAWPKITDYYERKYPESKILLNGSSLDSEVAVIMREEFEGDVANEGKYCANEADSSSRGDRNSNSGEEDSEENRLRLLAVKVAEAAIIEVPSYMSGQKQRMEMQSNSGGDLDEEILQGVENPGKAPDHTFSAMANMPAAPTHASELLVRGVVRQASPVRRKSEDDAVPGSSNSPS